MNTQPVNKPKIFRVLALLLCIFSFSGTTYAQNQIEDYRNSVDGLAQSRYKVKFGIQATLPITPTNADQVTQVAVFGQEFIQEAVNSLAFSSDGKLLAAGTGYGWGEPGFVHLWDVSTLTERAVLRGHTDWVRSVTFNPDGTLLASGGGRTVRLWDIATGELVRTLKGLSDAVSGNVTIIGDDGHVSKPEVFSDAVWSLAFSPDGATIAVGRGDPWVGPGSFQLHDVKTGEMLMDTRPEATSDPLSALSVYSLTFSPDGTLLAIVNGHLKVQLWDVATGQKRADLSADTNWDGLSVTFSPNGTMLASGGTWSDCHGWLGSCKPEDTRGETRLWNVVTGEPIAVLDGAVGGDQAVAFSPDGQILASAGLDGVVRLWEIKTWEELSQLDSSTYMSSVAFCADGTLLASGGGRTVRLWGVPSHS